MAKFYVSKFLLILVLLTHYNLDKQVNCAPTECDITEPPNPPDSDPNRYTKCKQIFDKSKPSYEIPKGFRTNGLANFCIVVNDKDGGKEYGGPKDEENFPILSHLSEQGAWSNQPTDNLPYSIGSINNEFKDEGYPTMMSHNPYYIEVTRISVKGDVLHNWLHFRIFMNRSEALGDLQEDRNKALHGAKKDGSLLEEKPDNARGYITGLLIMVKNQDGWPIGDFSQDIPCHRTCSKYAPETHFGSKSNALPCSFTPPRATSHPGMFVYDAHPGFYGNDTTTDKRPGKATTTTTTAEPTTQGTATTAAPTTTGTGGTRNPITKVPPPPDYTYSAPEKSRRRGVREVHATWSFTQDSCNFASKIYIQTLVLESVRTRIKTTPPEEPRKESEKLYGWTAQYNILHPTKYSLGAPDYVDLAYMKERETKVEEIDCHVPMFDAPPSKLYPRGFTKGQVPKHSKENPVPVPTVQQYMYALRGGMGFDKQYYGQHEGLAIPCTGETIPQDPEEGTKRKEPIPKVIEFLMNEKNKGVRCPCPGLPTSIPPEIATADPARLHGRLIHASHMAIAYMLLTPLACFVARYYKETFVSVFCFQEYWWYMWHVIILIIACVFNFGAVLSITRKKSESKLEVSNNLLIHVILGAMSIFVFYMEIFTGFFRVADPQKRLRQIFMHWLIGVLNNACAVTSMFSMAYVKNSGMSCKTVYTIIIWLLFVITCYIIMEIDMRISDKKLKLVPKRTWLPPPIARLFTRDAPRRDFRMFMLGVFILGLIILQILVSYYIWHSGGESCSESWEIYYNKLKEIDEDEGGTNEDGEGEDDPDE